MTASAIWQARTLLRGARSATLATVSDGQPFASLVTAAFAPDLSPLLLLSALSEHTRHLRAEPRCSLLVAGSPDTPNPQTAPRLTLTGVAEPEPDPALRARWVARHPYAAFYADLADFSLWRVRIGGGLLVGGFARADRLRAADLNSDPAAVETVAKAESSILDHCNADHADALATLARVHGGDDGPWRLAAVDTDGCDLTQGEAILRVAWSAPVADADGIRRELVDRIVAARRSA